MGKPNLLFVFSDQHRACSMGCYGNPEVITPNFDALAARGFRSSGCVSNSPVCVPMRGSMLTGLHAWNHRALTNDLPVRTDLRGVAAVFNEQGYHTGYIGKWHLGGVPRDRAIPAGERLGFAEWKAANCNHDYAKGYYFDEADHRHRIEEFESIGQTDLAIDFINRNRRSPWMLTLSWGPPHEPFDRVPQKYLDRYDPARLTLRPNVPETGILSHLKHPRHSKAEARHWLHCYYALITLLDEQFGRLMACLEATGQLENTIVIYTSDHGDMLGSQGYRFKQLPYEEAIMVPLLAYWQGRIPPRVSEALFGLVDLPVTLAGLAGCEWGAPVDGRDFRSLLRGESAAGREGCLIYNLVPCHQSEDRGGCEWMGLRTGRYTYTRHADGAGGVAFDNRADPFQRNNLIGVPEFAAVEHELATSLERELAACGYRFRPWSRMIREEGLREEWNRSQVYFDRAELD